MVKCDFTSVCRLALGVVASADVKLIAAMDTKTVAAEK
jgi:hypothetical protein